MDFALHFLRPWWWLALAPLPGVLWLLARHRGGRAVWTRMVDAALLPHLLVNRGTRQRAALAWVALAWLLATAALAGPAWQRQPTPLYVNGAARVVALSLSSDMLAADLQPDRMAHARLAVRDLIDAAGDARTALVAYAGAAFTVAPLTADKRTVLNLVQALAPSVMPVPGNDAAAGIRRGVELLQQAQVRGGEIVLVTDTVGQTAVAAARAARADGIRVDVLGIGTVAGAPVPQAGGGFASNAGGVVLARRDDAALRAVAAAGGGRYVVLQAAGGAGAAFAAPTATAGHASRDQHADVWRDGGVWLLPIIALVVALGFRRGWLGLLLICLLPLATPVAHAGTLDSWFANRDQRALQALQRGDPALAQQLATTPAMRGAADYQAGDFAGAAKAFAQGHDARSRYNLGNALAKQGDYPKAIAAYRQALQRAPDMADARANLAAVEAWLRKHPTPSHGSAQGQSGNHARQPSSSAHSGAAGSGAPKPDAGAAPNPTPRTGKQDGRTASSAASQAAEAGDAGASEAKQAAAKAAQQAAEAQRAAQGLKQELAQAQRAEKPFALGQSARQRDGKFNAQQRALLDAVPDDPGALLRRKFRLEWEQRQGQAPSQSNGDP